MRYNDLSGQRFGRLSVLNYVGNNRFRQALFNCSCDCGKPITVRGGSLASGTTKSCGCLHAEISVGVMQRVNASGQRVTTGNTRHGLSDTHLYKTYTNMKTRCYNQNRDVYKYYGGRGIGMCDEWVHDFGAFYKWATENGYIDGLEIERIDNDKGYSPTNCRWAIRHEQVMNRRVTVVLSDGTVSKTLYDWCKERGVNYKTAHARYKKGWAFEKIFAERR